MINAYEDLDIHMHLLANLIRNPDYSHLACDLQLGGQIQTFWFQSWQAIRSNYVHVSVYIA
jgi:hypothetical protein